MSTWFTEHPTTVYLILGSLGIVFLVAVVVTGRIKFSIGAGVVVVLALGVWLLDYLVETDGEKIERATLALAEAAETGDIDRLAACISPEFNIDGMDRDELLRLARHQLPPGEKRKITVWGLVVTPSSGGRVFTISCNAKFTGTYAGFVSAEYPLSLEFMFMKDTDGEWRVRKLKVMDAVGHEIRIRR